MLDELQGDADLLDRKLKMETKGKIDISKFIIGGYSFGAASAIYTAKNDERVQALIVVDPWLYPFYQEIESE